jgi:peptide/nickel transport system permease protein
MLEDAMSGHAFLNGLYLWILIPGLCIVFVVLSFTLIGYALDEIFNPKLRRR